MELSGTHAKLLCQCVHVELLLVEQQIDIVHSLGEESSFGIRQFHLLLLLLVACGFLAELIAQRVLSVYELFDDGAQFVHAERLGQIGVGTGFKSLNAFLLRNLGCYYYNRYMVYSLVASYLTAQFQSVHTGHHNVGNDNVWHDVFSLLQSVVAVRSVSHRIPPRQLSTNEGCNVVVVLYYECRVLAVLGVAVFQFLLFYRHHGVELHVRFFQFHVAIVGYCYFNMEFRALAHLAFHADSAVYRLHDMFNQRQSDTRAHVLRVGRSLIERLERIVQGLLVHTLARIVHVNMQYIAHAHYIHVNLS